MAGHALSSDAELIAIGRQVIRTEVEGLHRLMQHIGNSFAAAVHCLCACSGRVIVSGIGKSGVIGKKLAGSLTSIGVPGIFLHPVEALHGDLGLILPEDVLIVLSYSGETVEILRFVEWIHRYDIPIIAMTGNARSTLARYSTIVLAIGPVEEATPERLLPTTSTTVMLALSDALTVAVMHAKGVRDGMVAHLHPSGSIGRKILQVKEVMHRPPELPLVAADVSVPEAVREMSRKGFGCVLVVDTIGHLAGIFTDGDLRRTIERYRDVSTLRIGDVMTPHPKTLAPDALAADALRLMEKFRITVLPVIDSDRHPVGLVHIHDLWRLQMF